MADQNRRTQPQRRANRADIPPVFFRVFRIHWRLPVAPHIKSHGVKPLAQQCRHRTPDLEIMPCAVHQQNIPPLTAKIPHRETAGRRGHQFI
jgi:hypothetical protein